jgi:hypothetical protein
MRRTRPGRRRQFVTAVPNWHEGDTFLPQNDSGTGLSVIVGAVGPPHRGSFFVRPDSDRDAGWWMGFRIERRHVEEGGFQDTRRALTTVLRMGTADYEHVTDAVLQEIVN